MDKVLVICGPTAMGKTALGLELAKKFNGQVLSADSRHVYKNMDVVTGKDLPEDGNKILLTDLVFPNQDFNVSQWRKSAIDAIDKLHQERKLPIVVGGTGLYIKSLTQSLETIDIPQDKKLREQLKDKKAKELFEILTGINPVRAAQMNRSDKNNPRRLIRAIEVAQKMLNDKWPMLNDSKLNANFLIIGLNAQQDVLFEKIRLRVIGRIKQGALTEVQNLLDSGTNWEDQSMSAVGYKEFRDYFEKKRPLDEAIDRWVRAEQQYAKRQITWFKKQENIEWFDTGRNEWKEQVEKLVGNWYN